MVKGKLNKKSVSSSRSQKSFGIHPGVYRSVLCMELQLTLLIHVDYSFRLLGIVKYKNLAHCQP